MEIRFSNEARMDLEIIAYEGEMRFGHIQAEYYLTELKRAFDLIQSFPELGKVPYPDDVPEIRMLVSGTHKIFYQIGKDAILIDAIIHARANTDEILASRKTKP